MGRISPNGFSGQRPPAGGSSTPGASSPTAPTGRTPPSGGTTRANFPVSFESGGRLAPYTGPRPQPNTIPQFAVPPRAALPPAWRPDFGEFVRGTGNFPSTEALIREVDRGGDLAPRPGGARPGGAGFLKGLSATSTAATVISIFAEILNAGDAQAPGNPEGASLGQGIQPKRHPFRFPENSGTGVGGAVSPQFEPANGDGWYVVAEYFPVNAFGGAIGPSIKGVGWIGPFSEVSSLSQVSEFKAEPSTGATWVWGRTFRVFRTDGSSYLSDQVGGGGAGWKQIYAIPVPVGMPDASPDPSFTPTGPPFRQGDNPPSPPDEAPSAPGQFKTPAISSQSTAPQRDRPSQQQGERLPFAEPPSSPAPFFPFPGRAPSGQLAPGARPRPALPPGTGQTRGNPLINPTTGETTSADPEKKTVPPPQPSLSCGDPCMVDVRANQQQQGNKLDRLDALLSGITAVGQGVDLAVLNTINNKLGDQIPNGGIGGKLQAMQQFAEKAWRATRLDKVMNALTLITVLHNAAMLSTSLFSSLGDVTSTALQAIGIKDEEGNPLDVNELLTKTADEFASSLLGEEIWKGTKQTWHKLNRIVTTASNLIWTVRSIADSAREVAEWTAENTGKIGNALKRWRVVSEKAYGWMPEQVNSGTALQRRWDRIRNGAENLDDAASSLQGVLSEVTNVQQEFQELTEQRQAFSQALENATPKPRPENTPVKTAADSSDTASKSPAIANPDRANANP